MIDFLEWTGALAGLAGAFLLATHTRFSRYGWLAFLVANLALVGFALGIGRYGLLAQCVFHSKTATHSNSNAPRIPVQARHMKPQPTKVS